MRNEIIILNCNELKYKQVIYMVHICMYIPYKYKPMYN